MSSTLIVVDDPADWPLEISGLSVVKGRAYLTDPTYGEDRSARVVNLCQSYRYQSMGYYVSLLAEARGHKPVPQAGTIEDVQSQNLVRVLTDELAELVNQTLAPLKSNHFDLSVYFGRNVAQRYSVLARQLFKLLQAPLLQVQFEREEGYWQTRSIRLIGAREIPAEHREFAQEAAMAYFSGRSRPKTTPTCYNIAILHNPEAPDRPSNTTALEKFSQAARALGMRPAFITPADFGRLAEFDALFIRDTTFVHHYTYRFSRWAAAEGLVVIDDPDSILKCNNKVYLAEMLARHNLPAPRTLMVHRGNVAQILPALSLPCVLKQPDSSFSVGVAKVETEEELQRKVAELLDKSDLIVAQEWLPTDFDWRVGILDGRVIFVCKYYMVTGHWQIVDHNGDGAPREGVTEALAVGEAPEEVVHIALQAASHIGNGFYGVDIKQVGQRYCVIEINDNPNVDAGNEDGVLKDALYREVMGVFLRRLEERRPGSSP
ncbi:MAG TPA: RimK family protein [Rhodocyclaceae bacterium]|nr:RimK family protein [Rhodocyclaceae bacterium]